jgi:4-methyl-5(b-hydroxyethyl)-thiazole monophosphate biosynthesis
LDPSLSAAGQPINSANISFGNLNTIGSTPRVPTVLVVLAEGFEEIEAVAPIDLLRRAGATVTVAALSESIHVTGRNGMVLHADTTLSAVESHEFTCVLLPGGPGTKLLRADPRVRSLVVNQAGAKRLLAAICAAPTVLYDAGLLSGRRFTAHPSVAAEMKELLPSERTVVDDNLVTSRGAGTAIEFGLVLIERLFDLVKRQSVAESICS